MAVARLSPVLQATMQTIQLGQTRSLNKACYFGFLFQWLQYGQPGKTSLRLIFFKKKPTDYHGRNYSKPECCRCSRLTMDNGQNDSSHDEPPTAENG